MKKEINPLAAEYILRLIFKGEKNAEQFRKPRLCECGSRFVLRERRGFYGLRRFFRGALAVLLLV